MTTIDHPTAGEQQILQQIMEHAFRSVDLGKRGHVVVGAPNKIMDFMDFMGKYLTPRTISKRMYGRLLYSALSPDNRG